jgi:ribosomal protein S18 acetylase RimI-like enzyme
MTLGDVDAAAALHVAHMSYSFLAKLGVGFVRRLYRRLVLSRHGVAFVCEADGRVAAFIAAASDSAALRREFLRCDGLGAGLCAAWAVLRRPWLLPRAAETLAYGSRADLPGVAAEMLFTCLDPSLRRQGLAACMIEEVLGAFRQCAIRRVKVATEAANEPVNRLLAKLRFQVQRTFRLHGKPMLLHARAVDDCPPFRTGEP